jgi:hypothetical protein
VCEAQCKRGSLNQEGRQSRHQPLQPSWLRVVQGGANAQMCRYVRCARHSPLPPAEGIHLQRQARRHRQAVPLRAAAC